MVAKLDFSGLWLWPPNLTTEFFESALASHVSFYKISLAFRIGVAHTYRIRILWVMVKILKHVRAALQAQMVRFDPAFWPINHPNLKICLKYNFVDNWINFLDPQELHQLELYRGSYAHFTKPVSKYLFKQ